MFHELTQKVGPMFVGSTSILAQIDPAPSAPVTMIDALSKLTLSAVLLLVLWMLWQEYKKERERREESEKALKLVLETTMKENTQAIARATVVMDKVEKALPK